MAASVASLTRPWSKKSPTMSSAPAARSGGQGGQDTDVVSVVWLFQMQVRDVQETQRRACGRPRRRQDRAGHDDRLAASCSAAGPVA